MNLPPNRLTVEAARNTPAGTDIVVIQRSNLEIVEKLTLLRYAGHYRADSVQAFAVRDSEGKFTVRSERQLGLGEDDDVATYLAVEFTQARGSSAA